MKERQKKINLQKNKENTKLLVIAIISFILGFIVGKII